MTEPLLVDLEKCIPIGDGGFPPDWWSEARQYYEAHRAETPLPLFWTEDLTEYSRPCDTDGLQRNCPTITFVKETWKGKTEIIVDFTATGNADIYIADDTNEGFGCDELDELLQALLGATPPLQQDISEHKDREEKPDDRWCRSYTISPYPPSNQSTEIGAVS